MLDENLPTYRTQASSDNPQNTLLYFTHNGSELSPEYILKRPVPSESRNQYALGLLDAHYPSVIYAEVLVKPEWTQPSLSAAELRAQNGASKTVPLIPDSFNILLYNPDQSIAIKHNHGGLRSDSWDFEVPERSFRLPSSSEIDKNTTPALAELAPKVMLRWKRDGRLSKDMTCYMTGKSIGGRKSKEPDITVALYRLRSRNDSAVTIYEPNMARVEVEDRKGLEVALILSAEVIRDLYLAPRYDLFNTAGGSAAPAQQVSVSSAVQGSSSSPVDLASGSSPGLTPMQRAEIDLETKRLQAMVAEEKRQAKDREKRDQEEQERIRKMLELEEKDRRDREAEVEKETERLRKQYGVQTTPNGNPHGGGPASVSVSPPLPPRPGFGHGQYPPPPGPPPGPNQYYASGALGWGEPALPPRPYSVGPPPATSSANAGRKKHSSNPFGALLGRSEEDKRKKVEKKRSLEF